MNADPSCIFCQIIAGSAPGSFVHRGPLVSAFMDINPVTPGHMLVVSNDHYVGLTDTPPSLMRDIMDLGQQCAGALRASNLKAEGINLFLADGAAALQEVFHIHLHVFPRYRGDSFRVYADWNIDPSRRDLDVDAAALSGLLDASQGKSAAPPAAPGENR